MLKNIVRALRLPFLSASILPYCFGSFLAAKSLDMRAFVLGFFCVCATHLSANLINDYADSRSGADWLDKSYYPFFGGSKLIQAGVFFEKFYFYGAFIFAGLALISVTLLSCLLKSPLVIAIYLLIIFLSWQYSAKPLKFSYSYLGELSLFLLFGPALVAGGYFIQSGILFDSRSVILSLPFGFMTTAILFANEVPDYSEDKLSAKHNLVSIIRTERAYQVYSVLEAAGFIFIALGIYLGYLGFVSLFTFILVFPAMQAAMIIKNHYADKAALLRSSALSIGVQALASLLLIADRLL
ncbi:MAG: prenyltransferase [Candidatus Omnitrophota bacterium]